MNRFNLTMSFLLFAACAIQVATAQEMQGQASPQMASLQPGAQGDAHPDAWLATHMLNPGDMVRADDVAIQPAPSAVFGMFSIDRSPVGMEVRHRVLGGRPVLDRDVGKHSLVKANMPVRILWRSGAIAMQLDGRSLQDGAAGDLVRAVNTSSSRTIQGIVQADGTIRVGNGE